jgi:hypothetical protein
MALRESKSKSLPSITEATMAEEKCDENKGQPAKASEAGKPGLPALPEGMPAGISHKELAQLWDVVIKAHYLAYELGDPCARSGLAAARMALSLSEVLSNWATLFGEELEALEKRAGPEVERPKRDVTSSE